MTIGAGGDTPKLPVAQAAVPAAQFIADFLNTPPRDDWSHCRIEGDVDLNGVHLTRLLRLRDATFAGTLNLAGARLDAGADFTGSSFGKLILTQARVDGALTLDGVTAGDVVLEAVTVKGSLSMMDANVGGSVSAAFASVDRAMRLDGTNVSGDLSLWHAHVREVATDSRNWTSEGASASPFALGGSLQLESLETEGDVRLDGAAIAGRLALESAKIGGSLLCRAIEGLRPQIGGGVWMPAASIKGSASFAGARVRGDVEARFAEVTNSLDFGCAGKSRFVCSGSLLMKSVHCRLLDLRGGAIKGDVSIAGASIDHNLAANSLHVHGQFIGSSISVEGNAYFEGAVIRGRAVLENATVRRSVLFRTLQNKRCMVGRAWLLGLHAGGDLDLSGAQIKSSLVLQNAQIEQNFVALVNGGFRPEIGGEADLTLAKIGGSVELRGAQMSKLLADSATIAGSLVLTYDTDETNDFAIVPAHVTERVVATSASIGKNVTVLGTTLGGSLDLSGVRVDGDLLFFCPQLAADMLNWKLDGYEQATITNRRWTEVVTDANDASTSIGGDLTLERARILGRIELAGTAIQGNLNLRDATVRSKISTASRNDHTCRVTAAVGADFETLEMIGDIDLTGLRISGDVSLRDCSVRGTVAFDDGERHAVVRGILRLDGAEVTELLLSGRTFEGPEVRRPKVRVVLERAKIGRLRFNPDVPESMDLRNMKVERLVELRKRYKEILKRSQPFEKGNYIALETALRNAGDDHRADRTLIAMRRRDRRLTRSKLRKLLELFLEHTIQYGTNSVRLVWIIALLFAISLSIFRYADHVELEISPNKTDGQMHRSPSSWTLLDATLFAAQLHVPIVSLGVKSGVQPRGSGLRAYAMSVVALHWVLWPLLIASVSGLVRRRT